MYNGYLECTVKRTLFSSGAAGVPNAPMFSHILGKSVRLLLRYRQQKQSLDRF